jgi:hypothetical protein
MPTWPASHARITSSSRRQKTRRRDSSSARLTVAAVASPAPAIAGVACCGARRRGDDTDRDVTRGVIITDSSDSTHSPQPLQCRAQSSRAQSSQRDVSATAAGVSHATRDHADEAATNGPQRPLTAAGPAAGAAAGAAACITRHSDARTVTAAHTTGQPTHADSDATSVALTAAAPPALAEGTAETAA